MLTAVLAALVGWSLRIAYEWYKEHRRYISLLDDLSHEIGWIERESMRRAAGSEIDETGARMEPPLSTEAWRVIVASGDLRRLPTHVLRSCRELYSAVVAANHVGSQWCCFLQIAKLSPEEDVREGFEAAAAAAVSEGAEDICRRSAELHRQLAAIVLRSRSRSPVARLRRIQYD